MSDLLVAEPTSRTPSPAGRRGALVAAAIGPAEPFESPPHRQNPVNLKAAVGGWVTGDDKFALGVNFRPQSCGTNVQNYAVCPTVSLNGGEALGSVHVEPFGVMAPSQCSTFGFQANQYEERARALLDTVESHQVEKELWDGAAQTTNPRLAVADTAFVDLTPVTADGMVASLALLEKQLGLYLHGGQGMIHMSPYLFGFADANNAIERQGNTCYTKRGTIVVPGSGYSGSAPTGVVPVDGTEWMYGTGLVRVRASSTVDVYADREQSMNRTTNTIVMRAQRVFEVEFDPCCHLGIRVNPATGLGSAGGTYG